MGGSTPPRPSRPTVRWISAMAARPAASASASAATASSVSPASSARRAPLSCSMVTASEWAIRSWMSRASRCRSSSAARAASSVLRCGELVGDLDLAAVGGAADPADGEREGPDHLAHQRVEVIDRRTGRTTTATPPARTARPNLGPMVAAISPMSKTIRKGAKSTVTGYADAQPIHAAKDENGPQDRGGVLHPRLVTHEPAEANRPCRAPRAARSRRSAAARIGCR